LAKLPGEWSSVVTVITRINRNLRRFYFLITLILNFTAVHPLDTLLQPASTSNRDCAGFKAKSVMIEGLLDLLLVLSKSGSIPGGVTGDFFSGSPDRTMCPEVDSASGNEYQGFLLG